jgi:hypothetical protein
MLRLSAVRFDKFMRTGRTSPMLCGCEEQSGTSAEEYVVKLGGALSDAGLLNEFVGAKLARYFGLLSPNPAVVVLEQSLADEIAAAYSDKSAIVRKSVGLNFGTKALTGAATWPVDKTIPEVMLPAAIEIFAFDALIQNPDRRYNNPNLLTLGGYVGFSGKPFQKRHWR